METTNITPEQTASIPAPVEAAPVAVAAPVPVEAPVAAAAPAVAAKPAPAAAPKPAPVSLADMVIPKTTGKTPGGWNRFAGYNPAEAKNKKNEGRGGGGRR